MTHHLDTVPCKRGHIGPRKPGGACRTCHRDGMRLIKAKRPVRMEPTVPCKHGHFTYRTRSGYCSECNRLSVRRSMLQPKARERHRVLSCEWQRRNRHKTAIHDRRRQAQIPAWADRQAMAAVYQLSRELTRATGVEHHVDHRVPIAGTNVCGLHVEYNLQVITAAANWSKGNRMEAHS